MILNNNLVQSVCIVSVEFQHHSIYNLDYLGGHRLMSVQLLHAAHLKS